MNIHKRQNIARRTQSKSNQSRSFEERKKRRIVLGSIAGVLAIASLSFAAYKVTSLPTFALTDVQVTGAEPDVTPSLRAAVYRTLQGTYLGIFSRANALLYPKGAIMAAVGAVSPRIASVKVSRDGLHGLKVAISEKDPAAVACASLPNFDDNGALIQDDSEQSDCYFTDDSGLIFKRTPTTTPAAASGSSLGIYNRYYAPSLQDNPVGSYATSTEAFHSLQNFIKAVRAGGIIPEAILIKAGGEYELYVQNPTRSSASSASSTAIIYFNSTVPFATQLANLSAFWNSMSRTARAKNSALNYEYIDIRYGSNVFYRLIQ
ncbi:MAG: hypothetical protein JWO00_122 [Candidatus Parcubacteria bacterium]|nr:hypothetical protein [Candidatus Parcubacteria bacterium]